MFCVNALLYGTCTCIYDEIYNVCPTLLHSSRKSVILTLLIITLIDQHDYICYRPLCRSTHTDTNVHYISAWKWEFEFKSSQFIYWVSLAKWHVCRIIRQTLIQSTNVLNSALSQQKDNQFLNRQISQWHVGPLRALSWLTSLRFLRLWHSFEPKMRTSVRGSIAETTTRWRTREATGPKRASGGGDGGISGWMSGGPAEEQPDGRRHVAWLRNADVCRHFHATETRTFFKLTLLNRAAYIRLRNTDIIQTKRNKTKALTSIWIQTKKRNVIDK